ncbi:acetyltransferase [Thiomicrorhabdus sp.]|uniref:acetyltransferase n=1 Tax=Thiomicrorhabdus sp. TaxID=2039724 RepID=UPI0035683432
MVKIPLLLIGGGGHCASIIDVIESTEQYEIVGIVEAPGVEKSDFLGYPVVGTDDDLEALIKQTPDCVITVGQLQQAELRVKLYEKVLGFGGRLPVIVSPLARVARQVQIGFGTVIMHYALVNNLAEVSENCIVNSYAAIEHGSKIGAHSHISTRATVNGDCKVGERCLIGSCATLLQGISVASETVIGASALVNKDVTQKGTYLGVPAQKMSKTKE